jgi:PST family polysaccharide transporter
MVFGISSRVLTLITTLVLTRFIAPHEYGAVLTASISVITAGVLTSFAFGQYLIARKAAPDVAFQAAELHVALGAISMAVLFLVRVPLGDLLDTPEMVPFIAWYAVAHLIDRARYVPERLLLRDLRFPVIARINGAGELVFAGVALALAWRLGPYAIVVAVLVRAIVTAHLFFAAAPREQWLVFAPLRFEVVRGLFGYGLPIMIGAVSDRAATRWDNLIISKQFGPGVMAQYNLAYSLAEMPISHVADQIGEVLMPSFARLDDRQRRTGVIRAAALMALVICPLGIGLGAVAQPLVKVFFDERWHGMAPMLTILSIMTVFRPMTWVPVAYLQAVQQTRLVMLFSFSRAVIVLPLVAAFGYMGGPEMACVGGCIGYALHSLGTIVISVRVTGLPVVRYLLSVLRPLGACVPMFVAVIALESALEGVAIPAIVLLGVLIVVGALVYALSALVMARSTALELFTLGMGVIRPRKSAEPAVSATTSVNRW